MGACEKSGLCESSLGIGSQKLAYKNINHVLWTALAVYISSKAS